MGIDIYIYIYDMVHSCKCGVTLDKSYVVSRPWSELTYCSYQYKTSHI